MTDKETSQVETGIDNPKRIGMLIFFLVFGVFGIWAAIAPLDGAAHAPGIVIVRSNKQLIQHLEGGIVSELRARNGDVVQAGDPLLILDNTQSLAQLEIANAQYVALRAQEARLIAERDNLTQIEFPSELSTTERNALSEIASQNQLFRTRRNSLAGGVEVLEQRIGQLQSQLGGLRALQQSKQELADSFAEELRDVQSLLQEGFADKNRLRELERQAALLRGEAAELTAGISSTEIQIGETRLQILQQEREFQNDVATQLAETQTRLKDATERVTALSDIVTRTVITAPVSGIVNGMQIHTVGGIVPQGTPIAEIVPQSDELLIEARVSPIDIDRIAVGQNANIRFSSFSSSVPNIVGKVINVSADAFSDPHTGMSYYTARVEVTPEGLGDLGTLTLIPGMPAEIFIATGSRTFLQYVMKPFSNAIARSFIED
ncbi:MAG: HlyD family type I secretion periplasmic adaptor subunit [Pseudohongiella sp.]|nr:HlyD family type I secretion periplasmic adaptor subunit [Pseudohongiella sp.]